MPASYQFGIRGSEHEKSYTTGTGKLKKVHKYVELKNETLGEVDAAIARFSHMEDQTNEEHYTLYYLLLIEWAFAALMSEGGSSIEEKHVDWIVDRSKNAYGPDGTIRWSQERIEFFSHLVRWAFLERWKFSAWR